MAHGNVSLYFVANLVSNVNLLMIFRALGISVSYIFTFNKKKKNTIAKIPQFIQVFTLFIRTSNTNLYNLKTQ